MITSKYFDYDELKCKGANCCGGVAAMNPNLLIALDSIRVLADSPIYVSSGFRCITHNRKVGGVKASYHTQGMAADIYSKNLTIDELYGIIEKVKKVRGIGVYDNFIHIDVRYNENRVKWGKIHK